MFDEIQFSTVNSLGNMVKHIKWRFRSASQSRHVRADTHLRNFKMGTVLNISKLKN